jgi:hypothetical protein
MGSAPTGEAGQQGTRSSIQCGSNAESCLNASKHKGLHSKNLFLRPGTLCNELRLHGATA